MNYNILRYKKWLFVSGLVVCLVIYSRLSLFAPDPAVIFLDVGQGDASLLLTDSGQTILIDGGPDNILLHRLGEQLPYFKRRLDYIFISHFHEDHISGLVEVLKRYEVGEIFYASQLDSAAYQELEKVANERAVTMRRVTNEIVISFSPACRALLISPESLVKDHDENDSLITHFVCGSLRALFTGDSRQAVEEALISKYNQLEADILKAAHHGSKTANSELFLEKISPDIFVISVGQDNRFGHPHSEIIRRARNLGITVKRTDELGSIVIKSEK